MYPVTSITASPGLTAPLSLKNARHKCRRELVERLAEGWNGVISALPGTGKSSGVAPAVAETGIPATVLTTRGNEEQYRQFQKWAGDAGINSMVIPSFPRDCPTARGDHGDGWKRRVSNLRGRGITPATIHNELSPPCGVGCPYRRDMAEIIEHGNRYPLLVGHYKHAYVKPAIAGRAVFVDEFFHESFESKVTPEQISDFLTWSDGLPFGNFTDLIENRSDADLRRESREWFEGHGLRPSQGDLLDEDSLYGLAAAATWGILTSDDLGNGWRSAHFRLSDMTGDFDDFPVQYRVAYDGNSSRIRVLLPPDLSIARNIIGLDGTPTPEMWGLLAPELYEMKQVLSDAERRSYLTAALGHRYILTTNHRKPYAPKSERISERVNLDHDRALLESIRHREGREPGLIVPRRALQFYKDKGVTSLVDRFDYLPIVGSNRFEESRVGVVIGYEEYGDDFIQQWGAFAGVGVPGGDAARHGERDHGDFGNSVLRHMREHRTLQSVLRFGRDGGGATVYVDTNTLPSWVPVSGRAKVYTRRGNSDLGAVIDAARAEPREWFTAGELSEAESFHENTARKWLNRLTAGGYVEREEVDGLDVWRDHALEEIGHGIMAITNRNNS